MGKQPNHFYAFGPFLLDVSEHRLSRGEQALQLTPRQFELLWLFVQHSGHILTKNELIEKLWPDTYVEEATLTRSVSRLRELLAHDVESNYIETIPRQGYRFIGEVTRIDNQEEVSVASSTSPRAVTENTKQLRPRTALVLAILVLGSVTLGLFVDQLASRGQSSASTNDVALKTSTPKAAIIPFTTYPGSEEFPAFSPDGNQIAFVWDNQVYVKIVGTEKPLRLTNETGDYRTPIWSPDGRYVAFIRNLGEHNVIVKVPALSGPEILLAQIAHDGRGLSWTPDGKTLAVSDIEQPEERYAIFLLSLETGAKRKLTRPDQAYDDYPVFSPDGQTVAFIRIASGRQSELFVVAAAGGEPVRLTFDNSLISGLAWTPDGREIVFSSNRAGPSSLWKVPVTGGEPKRLAAAGLNARSLSISRTGNRLAYREAFDDTNIWRIEVPVSAGRGSASSSDTATQLISSTRLDHSPQISPDGKKIAFISDRSGREAIWICDSDGANAVQLESEYISGTPRWSPDGQYIAFDSRKDDTSDIYVVSTQGGAPRRLTGSGFHELMPSWSRDGQWVYFRSNRSGSFEIWKIPAAGGESVQMTKQGGFEAFESPDGKFIYFTKGRGPGGFYKLPVAGGEEVEVPELANAGYWRYWVVGNEGIYFVAETDSRHWAIKLFSFASRKVKRIAVMNEPPIAGPPGLTVSPDGRFILYTQNDRKVSDIVLVENF
jgi:Tol biopolymer transport system component/DNA-binding winged helix-turn-helix (wHTH) protein